LQLGSLVLARDVEGLAKLRQLKQKKGLAPFDRVRMWDKQLSLVLEIGLARFRPLKHARLASAGDALATDLAPNPLPQLRPALLLSTDQEGPQMASVAGLSHVGLRLLHSRDPFHRDSRDFKLAVESAGLARSAAMLTFLGGMNHAPWFGGAFRRQRAEVMTHALQLIRDVIGRDADLREGIAFDLGVRPEALDHISLQELLLERENLTTVGHYISPTRFLSVAFAFRSDLDRSWTINMWLSTHVHALMHDRVPKLSKPTDATDGAIPEPDAADMPEDDVAAERALEQQALTAIDEITDGQSRAVGLARNAETTPQETLAALRRQHCNGLHLAGACGGSTSSSLAFCIVQRIQILPAGSTCNC
jgi:hypothetical protein